jgi:hypothetical protein
MKTLSRLRVERASGARLGYDGSGVAVEQQVDDVTRYVEPAFVGEVAAPKLAVVANARTVAETRSAGRSPMR